MREAIKMLESFYVACLVGCFAAIIAFFNFKKFTDRLMAALIWFLVVTFIFFIIGAFGPKKGYDDFDGPECAAYC